MAGPRRLYSVIGLSPVSWRRPPSAPRPVWPTDRTARRPDRVPGPGHPRRLGSVPGASCAALRRLLTATLTVELRVADLTSAAACGFGVTGELSATADYTGPQAWANALQAAGFHSIRYHVRHDPRGDLTGIAWFGRAGRARRPPASYSQQLPATPS